MRTSARNYERRNTRDSSIPPGYVVINGYLVEFDEESAHYAGMEPGEELPKSWRQIERDATY